jgi:predicted lysophospholipase L1 biosynthesis ABC-type transport system permease subunit
MFYFVFQSTFKTMDKNITSADELKTIRKIMEESTRFLSLSGLSGIFAGFFAIAGAMVAWFIILL